MAFFLRYRPIWLILYATVKILLDQNQLLFDHPYASMAGRMLALSMAISCFWLIMQFGSWLRSRPSLAAEVRQPTWLAGELAWLVTGLVLVGLASPYYAWLVFSLLQEGGGRSATDAENLRLFALVLTTIVPMIAIIGLTSWAYELKQDFDKRPRDLSAFKR